jgi:hypothetical protein
MQLNSKLAALAVLLLTIAPRPSQAGIAVSITIAPPVLPVYVQPPCPQEGYLWTPGHRGWGVEGTTGFPESGSLLRA